MKLEPLIDARIAHEFNLWDIVRILLCGLILGPRLQQRLFNLIADIAESDAT